MVATRRRSAASGSLRCLQWYSRLRFRTEVPASQRSIPNNSDRRLTPKLAAVPPLPGSHFGADSQICCSRSAAQSTTARSVSGSGIDLIGSQMPTWPLRKRYDPPNLWTVPSPDAQAIDFMGLIFRPETYPLCDDARTSRRCLRSRPWMFVGRYT
jgi:hypothetical protein